MNEKNAEAARVWVYLGLTGVFIILVLGFVLSGSKKTIDVDDVRSGRAVALTTEVIPALSTAGSVVCPKDHTHGFPVCATCKKVMQPVGNGLFACPECGRVGLPVCPNCGELMHSAQGGL